MQSVHATLQSNAGRTSLAQARHQLGLVPVTKATLAPVTALQNVNHFTYLPDKLSIWCWSETGTKTCPDLQSANVAFFVQRMHDRMSGFILDQAKYQQGVSRSVFGSDEYVPIKRFLDAEMKNAVNVHEPNGALSTMTAGTLMERIKPCGSRIYSYSCSNPNPVTDARVKGLSRPKPSLMSKDDVAAICRVTQQCLEDARSGAAAIAANYLCPKSLSHGHYCPERTIRTDSLWELSLAMYCNSSWWAGAIVTIPVHCDPVSDPPPGDGGGGTTTPPDTGGGTPTPPERRGGTSTPRDPLRVGGDVDDFVTLAERRYPRDLGYSHQQDGLPSVTSSPRFRAT